MSKLILTDIDDTIIEFADPFQEWAEARGYSGEGRLREGYKIEEWLGVSRPEAIELMRAFGRDDQSWLTRPEPDALEVLPKLAQEGYRFVGITACGTDPIYSARRVGVVSEVFGFPFEGIHYVDYRASKRTILGSFRPAIWVEDNYQHAVDGATCGHRSYVVDRPYNEGVTVKLNRDMSGFDWLDHHVLGPSKLPCRVRDWHDIYADIQVHG